MLSAPPFTSLLPRSTTRRRRAKVNGERSEPEPSGEAWVKGAPPTQPMSEWKWRKRLCPSSHPPYATLLSEVMRNERDESPPSLHGTAGWSPLPAWLGAQPLFPCLSLVSLVLRVTRWRGEVTTSQGRRDRSEPRVMDEENEPRVTVVVLLRLVSLISS